MWKKLIITIPLIICLIVPTLVISSSAASLTVVDDMVVNNFKARIGYEINDDTYWSPDDCTLMRTLYPEKRRVQFLLNGPNGGEGILNARMRVFSFEIKLSQNVLTNQRLDFEISFSYDDGCFIGLGTEIYSKQTSKNIVSSLSGLVNYGSTMIIDDGKKIKFQILNVTSQDTIYVSFGFEQFYETHALLFDCYLSPGMSFVSENNPNEHLLTSSSSFVNLFYNDDSTAYFTQFPNDNSSTNTLNSSFEVAGGSGLIIRAKSLNGTLSGRELVYKADVSFVPFWVKYKGTALVNFDISDTRWYRVQFIVQLGNQGQICYAENLKDIKLSTTSYFGEFDILPSTVWVETLSDGTKKSYAHFDFDIRGSILNNSTWNFVFNGQRSNDVKYFYSYVNFYLTTPFNIYARSLEYSSKRDDADFIINAGVNVGVGDFGASDIQVLQQSLVNLESNYTISNSDINKLNQHATNLLSNGNFKSASAVITGFIDRFSVENGIYWGLMLACLTLGIVFYFIGRGK